MDLPDEIKSKLFDFCQTFIQNRKNRIETAISEIKNSLFDETKTTVGDKHHTNRARLQIERETLGKQLAEIERVEEILHKIDFSIVSKKVHLGSLVHTKKGSFFISISSGQAILGDKTYYCIAPNAPIGQILLGKKEGDRVIFRGEEFTIDKLE